MLIMCFKFFTGSSQSTINHNLPASSFPGPPETTFPYPSPQTNVFPEAGIVPASAPLMPGDNSMRANADISHRPTGLI